MTKPIIYPSCYSEIKRKKVKARGPFPCPNCGKLLRVPALYYLIPMYGAIPLSAVVGYLLGLRFIALFFFVVVLWLPIGAFLAAALGVMLVPQLEQHYPDYLDLNPRI